MNDLNCPYCGGGNKVDCPAGREIEKGGFHQIECDFCDKRFIYHKSISYSYEAYAADCLNGDEHNYREVGVYPNINPRVACSICESTKPLSEERRQEILKEEEGKA